ncbi:T9SS type A sorting domain-containing protein [bacterium]|nr:T9SS type A sorting domain-containing protein [bacterium]
MKKTLLTFVVIALSASCIFAANFVPSKTTITGPGVVQYDFAGKSIDVPVTVSGTPALVTFLLFTKDKADQIVNIQNGFLGWHYVNKVDTCIFFSSAKPFDVGNGTITWDGKDQDGKMVPAGVYTYYLWGYDHAHQRVMAMYKYIPSFDTEIIETDGTGQPLTNPLFCGRWWRWTLGTDPMDSTLIETTKINVPSGYGTKNRYAVDPRDHNYVYLPMHNKDSFTGGLFKYQWVPNGDAVQETTWGDNGAVLWSQPDFYHMNATNDNNYLYVTSNPYKETDVYNDFRIVSFDGNLEQVIDFARFWGDLDDLANGGQANGGPDLHYQRGELIYFGCHCSSIQQVVNPVRGMENQDDFVVYVNQNGDYILDYNFQEDSPKPWVNNDFNAGTETYGYVGDVNGFGMECIYDLGALSFGLLAPDGTGVNHFAFAGETANGKYGLVICDNGSAFDGLYSTKGKAIEGQYEGAVDGNTWYSGQDSFKGILTNAPLAVEEAPAAFSVAQNTPNPFNPSTSISFSIANAGNVTVEIFNVAGQKVSTVTNEFMDAGTHSLTWNASSLSAGVYFYTVKSGDFSKTMKMTLLK